MAKILITDGMDKSAIADLKKLGHVVTEQFYPEPELVTKSTTLTASSCAAPPRSPSPSSTPLTG